MKSEPHPKRDVREDDRLFLTIEELEGKTSHAIDTDCRKCGAPMRQVAAVPRSDPFWKAVFTVTGYRCDQCGHWNDLKRRKKKPLTP